MVFYFFVSSFFCFFCCSQINVLFPLFPKLFIFFYLNYLMAREVRGSISRWPRRRFPCFLSLFSFFFFSLFSFSYYAVSFVSYLKQTLCSRSFFNHLLDRFLNCFSLYICVLYSEKIDFQGAGCQVIPEDLLFFYHFFLFCFCALLFFPLLLVFKSMMICGNI